MNQRKKEKKTKQNKTKEKTKEKRKKNESITKINNQLYQNEGNKEIILFVKCAGRR